MDETPAPCRPFRPWRGCAPTCAAPDPIRLPPLCRVRLARPAGPQHFTPRELVFNLLGRLRLLAEHHGGQPAAWAWDPLLAAGTLTLDPRRLHWHECTRYSSRQRTP
ncbi:MAG: hypothetical protein KBE53_07770 [Chromatiaceae bacterium]|nr:hypothetical protein [Chromatiaceae bacterium]